VHWFAAIDPNCSIAKIWTGLTISDAELNDVDSMAIRTDERSSEISGEPTRLQLQL
jgi:hypothetical protein